MAPEEATTEAVEEVQPDVTVDDLDLLSALDLEDDDEGEGKEEGTSEGEQDEEGAEEVAAKKAAEEAAAKKGKGEKSAKDKPTKADKKAAAEAAAWYKDVTDTDLQGLVSGFDSRDAFLAAVAKTQKALGIEAPVDVEGDWRKSIKDDKLRDHVGRFASPTALAQAHMELRNQLSNALVPPGKDATKEERTTFAERLGKMIGVPDKPEDYTFPPPPEGEEITEAQQASRDDWAKFFHSVHLPKPMAEAILNKFDEDLKAGNEAIKKADDRFAESEEAELRSEWAEDYDKNKTIAVRAARELFGDAFDDIMQSTLPNGRLMMDSRSMLQPLVRIGREMLEGSMDVLSTEEKETIDDQVKDLRKRASEAQGRGESRLANKLFQEEQALLSKVVSRQPIIGAGGRGA